MSEKINDQQVSADDANSTDEISVDRRKALGKLSKYAYAAPVVTGMLLSKKAAAFSPPPPGGGGFP